jgi:hypothetical protein
LVAGFSRYTTNGLKTNYQCKFLELADPNLGILEQDPAGLSLKVFPNPATYAVNLFVQGLDQHQEVEITVVSLTGQELIHSTERPLVSSVRGVSKFSLDVCFLNQGTYGVRIRQGSRIWKQLLIKQ